VWQKVLPFPIGGLNYFEQVLDWNGRPTLVLAPTSTTKISLLSRDGKSSAVDSTIELDPNLAMSTPGPFTFAKVDEGLHLVNVHSASNRATTCLVSMPSLMTLRATLRRTGSFCSAT